jgi:predicted ribosomally synthesized peptide with SipW-like signal peptide
MDIRLGRAAARGGASVVSRKVALSLAALGAAGAIAGLGTFASFTSTTSASQTVASGTVTIALGATGAATNRLTVNASGIVAGDSMQRAFDLSNSGSQDLASVSLTTSASPSSLLDSDGTNGLQMVVDRCSLAWVEAGVSPAFTYTCLGTTSSVVASQALTGSGISMANLSALTAGGSDHLRVTLSLPSGAGNTFQNLSSTVTYSFAGTQRAGSAH